MEIKTDNYSFDFVNDEKGCLPVVLHRRVVINPKAKEDLALKIDLDIKEEEVKKASNYFFEFFFDKNIENLGLTTAPSSSIVFDIAEIKSQKTSIYLANETDKTVIIEEGTLLGCLFAKQNHLNKILSL